MKEKNKGITLIALVITIIVLLILAAVSIATLAGENGILTKAQKSAEEYKIQAAKEKIDLAIMAYQVNKENTTLYDELIKIEGLTYITPSNSKDGPPYTVIVDGYEFVIGEDLSVKYTGEKVDQNKYTPEIIDISYETGEVYTLMMSITARTKDEAGLKQIIVSHKKTEGDTIQYENIKVEEVSGKEVTIQVEIPINGEYVIQVIGQNNQIAKKEVSIQNIEEGSILATIRSGEVTDNHVTLTIRGENQGIPIQAMELYIAGEKVKTYQYQEEEMEQEETYLLENMEFYKNIPCYVKVRNTNGKEVNSTTITVANTKTIVNVTDLQNLATQVNGGNTFQDKTVHLIADVTTGVNWIPIGYWDRKEAYSGKTFAGTFEGNNHSVTVTSLSKDTIYQSTGLFGSVIGGTIKNLTINGTMDASSESVGGIVGAIQDAVIYNCINNSINTNKDYEQHGGIVGYAGNSQIQNCTNTSTIYGKSSVGGICGKMDSSTISNSTNSGLVKCYGVEEILYGTLPINLGLVGGISGGIYQGSTIEGSTNIGEVTGDINTVSSGICAGGITGWMVNSNVGTSKNKGKIDFNVTSIREGGALGGIIGAAQSSTINQCFNTGVITSKYNKDYGMNYNVGGVVGAIFASTIKNTYNTGEIYGYNRVGGILGYAAVISGINGDSYLYNSYNASQTIKGNSDVGDFAGRTEKTNYAYTGALADTSTIGSFDNCVFGDYGVYTLSQMKTTGSGLLTLISKGVGNGIWAQSSSINGGLPYLVNNRP